MDVPHEVEGEGDAKPVPTPPTSSSTPHEPLADDSSIDAAHSVVDEEPKRLLSLSNLKILVVPVTCGLFYGYNIVFVAVYYQMHLMSMDCSMAKGGKVVCETLPSADCRWYTNSSSGGYCGWTDVTCRVLYPNSKKFGGNEDSARSGCLQDNRCTWSYGDSECKNPVGLDSLRYAVFAVAMTIGGVFGSWAGGPVVSALGSKLSFVCAGIVSCACCLMYHVGIGTDEFWVIIGARVVLGFCIGITGVASPLYVDQNAPKEFKRPIGFLYMISVCFGILLVSIMGLALGQSVEFSSNVDTHLVARLQGVTSLSSVISVGVVCLGLFVKESRVNFNRDVAVKGAVEVNPDEYTYREMLPQLLVAFIMTCAYQLTGANSITSYAPTIMGNLGLAPLVGTFLMMLVCFLCSISSILLSNRVSSRTIFLTGSFTLSTICVCLCGIPVYPGVASEEVKNIVAVIGTLSFMGVFQLCLGPCFYVLTQELFPLSFRPKGASFTQTSQFLLNGVVCAAYPFAAEGLSGGAAGNQNKGQSIVFMSFGVIGFVCSTLEAFFLHPWKPKE